MADNFRFAQLQPYSLAGAGAITSATTILLKSMTDIDGNSLTMAGDFGTIGFGTLEPGNGINEEQICFTGLVNNSNGTVTLTGVKNVSFVYPYTQTSGLSKTHAGSTPFIISNTSGFYDQLTSKDDDETVNGVWTFTQSPIVPDPVNNTEAANKEWVLSVVNGGPVTTNALVESGTAGETITIGQPVYLKAADGLWWKATGATAATVNVIQLGIAQGAGTAGNPISGGVLRRGTDINQSGGAAGSLGYISDTSTISTTTGTVQRVVGNFLSATTFNFDPNFYYLPTADIKAAEQGNVGTPSNTNRFITQQGLQDVQSFTVAGGTWTKPSGLTGAETVLIELWGAGGGGGGNPTSGGTNTAGGGGGGGAYVSQEIIASQLTGTVSVTVGAGGPGGIGNAVGTAGDNTTFGTYLTAYGGGGGGRGNSSGNQGSGGGGGGALSAGAVGTTNSTGGGGGRPDDNGGLGGSDGAAVGGGSIADATFHGGGGGGGNTTAAPTPGASSVIGGGGGGAGAMSSSVIAPGAGGVSKFGGSGGIGGQNADGVAGTIPGGGGGGGSHATLAANGGAGANGQARITVFR